MHGESDRQVPVPAENSESVENSGDLSWQAVVRTENLIRVTKHPACATGTPDVRVPGQVPARRRQRSDHLALAV